MSKIVVMGGGSWGTTLAVLLASKGNEVVLWEYNEKYASEMQKKRENITYLPGIKFPDKLFVTNSLVDLLKDSKMVVFSVPSQYLRNIVNMVSGQIEEGTIIVNTGKGIEVKSKLRLSEVIKEEILGKFHKNIVALTGPTHAEEVAKKLPSAITAASDNIQNAKIVQEVFNTKYFRVYVNNDIAGAELGGALKNCIAIAAGISDGLGLGDNSKSALMARGLSEMIRFGKHFGADFKTFSGLAGIGDLITTCTSKHSRNRHVGEKLGEGKSAEEIIGSMVMVAEGVPTVKAVHEIAVEKNIDMPIIEGLYQIIYNNKKRDEIISQLMTRELKEEFE